jgi:hypothetical protein
MTDMNDFEAFMRMYQEMVYSTAVDQRSVAILRHYCNLRFSGDCRRAWHARRHG